MSNLEKAINKLKLGKITGKVWATIKDEKLQGTILYLMQPMDENLNPVGKEVVAVDTVGSREDDIVYWVGAAEATFVFDDCSSVIEEKLHRDVFEQWIDEMVNTQVWTGVQPDPSAIMPPCNGSGC